MVSLVLCVAQMPGGMPGGHLRAAVCPQMRLSERRQMLPHQRGVSVQRGLQGPQLPGPLLPQRPLRTQLRQVLPLQDGEHTQVTAAAGSVGFLVMQRMKSSEESPLLIG